MIRLRAGMMRRRRRRAVIESWQLRLECAEARPGWWERAACRGLPDGAMFPSSTDGVIAARMVCDGCPVRLDCLGAARDTENDSVAFVFGVRGGLVPAERAAVYSRQTHQTR